MPVGFIEIDPGHGILYCIRVVAVNQFGFTLFSRFEDDLSGTLLVPFFRLVLPRMSSILVERKSDESCESRCWLASIHQRGGLSSFPYDIYKLNMLLIMATWGSAGLTHE
jgi:hypothetical protein